MDVRMREVPAQVVVTEQRMVSQQSLERWLPEAMARVHKTAGSMAAGTAEQPYLLRDHVRDEPVFIPMVNYPVAVRLHRNAVSGGGG
jgi:hypothetical protein